MDIHRRTYRDHVRLRQHVENSLEGEAANLASSLGENSTLEDLLKLLEDYYRTPDSLCQLHQELFHLEQRKDEKVAQFAIRLCTQTDRVMKHQHNTLTVDGMEDMKKGLLYGGMNPSLKTSLCYLMDEGADTSYKKLLVAARELEKRQDLSARRSSRTSANSTDDRAKQSTGTSYAHGSLFPQRKLKGHGVTSKAQNVEVTEEPAEEGGELEQELLEGEDLATQLACKIQQTGVQKKRTCLLCDSPDHLMKGCTWYGKLQALMQELNPNGVPGEAAREAPQTKDPKSGSNNTASAKK